MACLYYQKQLSFFHSLHYNDIGTHQQLYSPKYRQEDLGVVIEGQKGQG